MRATAGLDIKRALLAISVEDELPFLAKKQFRCSQPGKSKGEGEVLWLNKYPTPIVQN